VADAEEEADEDAIEEETAVIAQLGLFIDAAKKNTAANEFDLSRGLKNL
jgi:hypothetical protein